MLLTTKGRYAVMAMVDLAANHGAKPVGLAAIADRQQIPLAYLEQIFARLKKAGLVLSVRGPGGGYKLSKEAGQISIAYIVSAADETIKMTRCGNNSELGCTPDKTRCMTHDLWEGLGQHIFEYLNELSLADVVGRKVRNKFPRNEAALADAMLFAEIGERAAPAA